jgi:hypothetical protein
MTAIITEPGIYDIPEDQYHADPVPEGSLSASGAKKLLADGGPARYRYHLDNPEPSSDALDLGTAAHKLVLGVGAEIAEVRADNWRTKAANEAADEARARGAVPLLSKDLKVVRDMAAELRKHPVAAALFSPGRGQAEMSAFWVDEPFGIWRRCRFDWMPSLDVRPIIGDYKTCQDASKHGFPKSVANFGYYLQAAWYCDAYQAMFGGVLTEYPTFILVAQEKAPPYLVATYQLDAEAMQIGRADAERAMEIWRDCREAEAEGRADAWPGYSPEIETIALPRWSRAREDFYA